MKAVSSPPPTPLCSEHSPVNNLERYRQKWPPLLILLISAALLIGCDTPPKQHPTFTVGILNPNPGLSEIVRGFKETLTPLCAKDGREVIYLQPIPLHVENIDSAIAEMQTQNVDMYFTLTTPATKKAQQSLSKNHIPIVFAPIYDPVRSGVVADLRENKDNITGIKIGGSNGNALEWLQLAAPNVKTIFVPFSGKSVVEYFSFDDLKMAASKLGIELLVDKIETKEQLEHSLHNIPQNTDAIWLLHSIFLVPQVDLYVKSAIENKVLLASGTGTEDHGSMITYGPRHYITGARAGRLAHQIARGISPADLPIETTDFFLKVNLKTATAAGIEIPNSILMQATDIVRDHE